MRPATMPPDAAILGHDPYAKTGPRTRYLRSSGSLACLLIGLMGAGLAAPSAAGKSEAAAVPGRGMPGAAAKLEAGAGASAKTGLSTAAVGRVLPTRHAEAGKVWT